VILTGTGEVPSEIGKKIDEGQPATLGAWHRASQGWPAPESLNGMH
jgi:hypothetical protein